MLNKADSNSFFDLFSVYIKTINSFHIVISLSNHSSIEKIDKAVFENEGADCLLVALAKHIMMVYKSMFWLFIARMRYLILLII